MPRPDLVGVTVFTSQPNRAYEVASQFRHLGVPVIMGGIHATLCLNEAMARVDAVVTGEAENIWTRVPLSAGVRRRARRDEILMKGDRHELHYLGEELLLASR